MKLNRTLKTAETKPLYSNIQYKAKYNLHEIAL